ncbi:MAG: response regulator transcription factor [Candidatus Acidiferrales bacterium]
MSCHEIRLFIVSGNRLLREVLARLFKARARISVSIAEQLTAETAEQIVSANADVLLLDTPAPLFEQHEHVRQMRAELPALKIVLMAMEDNDRLFLEAVKHGVTGYVLRDAAASDVVAAVRAVAQSAAICPPQFSRVLFDFVAQHSANGGVVSDQLPFPLTRRERQLVPLIARGLTNKEIAAHFNLSEQTIKNHIHRICSKVGADGRRNILEACGMPTMFQ